MTALAKDWKGLIQVGGWSLIVLGIVAIVSIALSSYLTTTVILNQGQVFSTLDSSISFPDVKVISTLPANSTFDTGMRYIASHALLDQTLFALNALASFLILPAILSVYAVLRDIRRTTLFVGLGIAGLSIILGIISNVLAFTTISLTQFYVSATSEAQRASFIVASLNSNLTSDFLSLLGSLLISVAIILISYIMTRGGAFGKSVGYLGILAGAENFAGNFLPNSLSIVGAVLSIFLLIWIFATGIRLIWLGNNLK